MLQTAIGFFGKIYCLGNKRVSEISSVSLIRLFSLEYRAFKKNGFSDKTHGYKYGSVTGVGRVASDSIGTQASVPSEQLGGAK